MKSTAFFSWLSLPLPQVGPTKEVWEQSQMKRPQPSRQEPPCMQGLEEQEPPSLWQKLTIEPVGRARSCEWLEDTYFYFLWSRSLRSQQVSEVHNYVTLHCIMFLWVFGFTKYLSHLSLASWHRRRDQMPVHWSPGPSCSPHSPDPAGQTTPPGAPPRRCSRHQRTALRPGPAGESLLWEEVVFGQSFGHASQWCGEIMYVLLFYMISMSLHDFIEDEIYLPIVKWEYLGIHQCNIWPLSLLMTSMIVKAVASVCNGLKNSLDVLSRITSLKVTLEKYVHKLSLKTIHSQPPQALPGVVKSLAPSSTVMRPAWASLLSVTSCHQPSSILLLVALTRRDPDPRLRCRYRWPSSSSKAKKSPLRGKQRMS